MENVIHFAHKRQLAGAPIFRCGNRNIHLHISHHRVTFLPSQQAMVLKKVAWWPKHLSIIYALKFIHIYRV